MGVVLYRSRKKQLDIVLECAGILVAMYVTTESVNVPNVRHISPFVMAVQNFLLVYDVTLGFVKQ